MDIDKLLTGIAGGDGVPASDRWSELIKPSSSYLVVGDVGAGKSGLAYWLLERFSKEYGLTPYTVGIPAEKAALLPENFHTLDDPTMCTGVEDAVVMIDEADIQLPMGDRKMKDYVVNFLSLPRHRNQIFILIFHYPRLVLGTYLPFFSGFFLKRPPYLMEFASKSSKEILAMMRKAEERFAELQPDDVVKNTYVVSPRIRWEGMITNGLASFWCDDLSKVWAGVGVVERQGGSLQSSDQLKLSPLLQRQDEAERSDTTQRLSRLRGLFSPEPVPYDKIIEYDKHFSMEELRQQCRDAGLSTSGDKKMLAAKLIAKEEEGECQNE